MYFAQKGGEGGGVRRWYRLQGTGHRHNKLLTQVGYWLLATGFRLPAKAKQPDKLRSHGASKLNGKDKTGKKLRSF